MKSNTLKSLLALALLGLAGTARAQYTSTPNAAGGVNIVGSGPSLGPLSLVSTPPLSAGGHDNITINGGATATSSGNVIFLQTPGNTFTNNGTLTSSGSYLVHLDSANGNTIVNNGLMDNSTTSSFSDGIYYKDSNNNLFINNGTITSYYSGIEVDYNSANNTFINNGTITAGHGEEGIETDDTGAVHNTFINFGTINGSYAAVDLETGQFNMVINHGLLTGGSVGFETDDNNNSLFNYGLVKATSNSGEGIYVSGQSTTINNYATGVITGKEDGIYIETPSYDPANNVLINNWGSVTATNSGNGIGVRQESYSTLNNWGMISGGEYGVEMYDSNNTVNNWGSITSTNRGIYFDDDFNVANNRGLISGGHYGVYLNGAHDVLNNWGTIVTPSTATAAVYDNGNSFNTINNYGLINGNGATAINVHGSNHEVINLLGHSGVIGKITLTGLSNVVNLNFTGLSPATITSLNGLLKLQGVNSGTLISSVQFTLRGVVYNIDPPPPGTFIVNSNLKSYQMQALTPNQAAIGASLDSLKVNPAPGSPLFNLLNALDAGGNMPGAFDALSPQKLQILGDIATADANFITLNIDQRLNNLRDGSESIDTTGMGGENSVAGWTKNDSKDGKGVIKTKPEEKRWGFFGSGDVVLANIDARDGISHSKFTTGGLVLGLDGKINENWVVGSLFSYQYTSANLDDQGSKANVASYSGGLYTGYHNGGYYGNGLLTYTRNNYDTFRAINIPGFNQVANGSTNGDQFATDIDGGYDFNLTPAVTVGPIAGLQYVHLGVDGFTESGAAGANLAVGSQDVDSLRSRMGARIAYHKQVGKEVAFAAEGRAEWQHEFLDDSRGISATFAGSGLGGFSVQTSAPQRDAALVGAGLNVTIRNRMTVFADYDLQAGQSSYFEQSVRGGLKFSW